MDELKNGGCPAQAERILNSGGGGGGLLRSGGCGRGRGPEKGAWNHISQDLNCAMINMQIELLSRWMPFSFQHTELEVTTTTKWVLVNMLSNSVTVDAFSFSCACPAGQTSGLS